MVDEVFTDPDESRDEWVDVRMTDPAAGEWDIDVVVVEGSVEYVDLRVKPELLSAFVECLVEDVDPARAESILSSLAERAGDSRDDGAGDA